MGGGRKRRYLSITGRLYLEWLTALAIFAGVPFLITGLKHGFGSAFDILILSSNPSMLNAGGIGVWLSIAGYIAVPVVIGTLAAVQFSRFVSSRSLSDSELHDKVQESVAAAFEKRSASKKTSNAEAPELTAGMDPK